MSAANHRRFALAIHGGCGTLSKAQMTPALEAAYRTALHESLEAGHRCLQGGGSALDAVSAAVVAMEDSPLFNAGHGSVFNAAGGHELDAAIMDGRSLLAGAIAAARRTRNPVLVARAVMEKSDKPRPPARRRSTALWARSRVIRTAISPRRLRPGVSPTRR
jgi:beta-aspartyl-peptidase (threonine type)